MQVSSHTIITNNDNNFINLLTFLNLGAMGVYLTPIPLIDFGEIASEVVAVWSFLLHLTQYRVELPHSSLITGPDHQGNRLGVLQYRLLDKFAIPMDIQLLTAVLKKLKTRVQLYDALQK